jgi:hypothetical protein
MDATVRVMRADEKHRTRSGRREKSVSETTPADVGDWLFKGGEDYERSASIGREEKSFSSTRLKINLGSSGKSTDSVQPEPLTGVGSGTGEPTGSRLKISMSKSGKCDDSSAESATGPTSPEPESAGTKEPIGPRLKIKMRKI